MLAVTLVAIARAAAGVEAFALALSVPLIFLAALVEERAGAETALRRSEVTLRTIFESNVLPIVFWRAGGRITEANDAYLRLVQCTRRALEAGEVRWDRLTPPDHLHVDQHAIEEVSRGDVCTPYRTDYVLRDGRRVPVLVATDRLSGDRDHGVGFAIDMTALRRAEAALRAREPRYRHLFESAAVALWEEDFSAVRALLDSLPARGVTDLRAHAAAHPAFVRRALRKVHVVGVNEAAVRLFGARDEAELVAAGEQLFTEESLGAFAEALVAIAEGRPAFEAYTTARTLDGRRAVLFVAARFPDWQSGHRSVLLSAVDVTARRRAEVEQAARAELRTLIELAPIGIAWADDPQCNRIVGNRALNRIFGARPGANLSRSAPGGEPGYRVFKDGRELETPELPLHYAAASGVTVENFECDIVRDDGVAVHVLTSAAPVRDEAGRVRGAIGAVVDVTAHRLAVRQLSAAEARVNSTLDALSAHIAIVDETGTILAVNRAWREFAVANEFRGTSHGVGWNYLDVCRSATGAEMAEARAAGDGIRAVMDGSRTQFRLEYACPGPPGLRWFQLRVTRFFEDGLVRVVVAHENVTEIKLAERALRTLTGRLLGARDEERRRVARELHDGPAQMLVGVSIGLERLRSFAARPDETHRRLLDEIAELNGRALKEIRTLSYLLHPPELEALGLAAAIRWYVEGFASRSGIKVEFEGPDHWERLPSDTETALFRIVQEALANVHRHSGSATARVDLCRANGTVELRVGDAGRGMPAEPGPVGGGHGRSVGVGIGGMRERVRLLGGRLEILSGGDGTTVSVVVPVPGGPPRRPRGGDRPGSADTA